VNEKFCIPHLELSSNFLACTAVPQPIALPYAVIVMVAATAGAVVVGVVIVVVVVDFI